MITPSSNVRFLNVPFSPSQNNVMKFGSLASQQTYMESKIVYSVSGCTYLREGEGEYLRVPKVVDSLYNCNYVMFQNPQFGQKWFYAFIDKLIYKNGNISDVVLKMDVYQTFQFDYTLNDSFIERQTFTTDYYNTLADTPSTGDLKVVYEYEVVFEGCYFVLFNSNPTIDDSTSSIASYPSIGSYSMPCLMAKCSTAEEMSELVQAVANKGRGDRIQACYYCPVNLNLSLEQLAFLPPGDLNITQENITLVHTIADISILSQSVSFTIPYTPTFKKELSYPYAKLEIVDRITGKFIELDLSKFQTPLTPEFKITFNISDNVEYKLVPMYYNGMTYSIENALVINPQTELPTFSNSYAKYLKDNLNSNILAGVMAGASAVGSIYTGNVAGAVGSFGSIASIINADSVARKQPNQVSGLKGGAFDYVNYTSSFMFRLKVMDSDHMKIARNFWNAYGYPVRRIDTFNNTSNRYNFIKTVGANITASTIPAEYLRELENIYDNGVTIWNNNYLDYNIL